MLFNHNTIYSIFMDKQQRKAIMSKFLNRNKKPIKPPAPINNTNTNTGFYETLKFKQNLNIEQTKRNTEICKKIGNINDLIKKRYMIPSQFPNITQAHQYTKI